LRERADVEEVEEEEEEWLGLAWVLNEIIPFFIFILLQLVWVPLPN
jgi:hypothetical protein